MRGLGYAVTAPERARLIDGGLIDGGLIDGGLGDFQLQYVRDRRALPIACDDIGATETGYRAR